MGREHHRRVDATDPDDFPVPMRTELSAETGVFADRFARETLFVCGAPGRPRFA